MAKRKNGWKQSSTIHKTWKWLHEEKHPKRVMKRSKRVKYIWRKGDIHWTTFLQDSQ